MKKRCAWCEGDETYMAYHDNEWGVPVRDDRTLFEFLILETFQAGLSWITILRKRAHFRNAFHHFDVHKVATYTQKDEERLLSNEGIIRNKLKIKAAISNAQAFIGIQKAFGSFSNYIWSFVDGKPIQNTFENSDQIPANTPLSDAISADLKKRGFKFVGSTVIYAHMQATGMVNDHTKSCFRHQEIARFSSEAS